MLQFAPCSDLSSAGCLPCFGDPRQSVRILRYHPGSGLRKNLLKALFDPCHGTLSADYLRLVWRSVRSADCRRRPGTPDSRRALQLVKDEHLPTRWTTSHIFKITRTSVGPRLFGGAGKRKSLPGYTVISARPKAATTVALEIEAYGGFEIETCQLLQDGETYTSPAWSTFIWIDQGIPISPCRLGEDKCALNPKPWNQNENRE